ncbi:MAG: hypothetical protein KJ666_00315 [Bacteroidetes bacterium]|nr:hypothetical protein [Bacteroidota bacterium]
MKYTIIYERITEPGFEEGYYYAHIPALDLTTHGFGIDGAKASAIDLVKLWVEEKKSAGEDIRIENESLVSTLEIENDKQIIVTVANIDFRGNVYK